MDNPVGARQKAFKVAANLAVALASCFFKTGTIRRGDGMHVYAPNRVPVVTTPKHARAVENLATAVDTDQVAHHRLISASPAKSLDKIGEPNWKRFVDPVLIAVLNPCAILASETALSGEAGRPPNNRRSTSLGRRAFIGLMPLG